MLVALGLPVGLLVGRDGQAHDLLGIEVVEAIVVDEHASRETGLPGDLDLHVEDEVEGLACQRPDLDDLVDAAGTGLGVAEHRP
jgi:hypothetical protein